MRSFTRVRSVARKLRSAINPPPQRRLRRPAVLPYDRVTKYSTVIPGDHSPIDGPYRLMVGPNMTRGGAGLLFIGCAEGDERQRGILDWSGSGYG
jgi:hypothetical protein